MLIGKNERLVIIGDSVTDCGRTQPVAEGLFDPLGRGYPNFVNALLVARYPELNIRVTNVGTSGNNVRDLKARWDRDVIGLHPDWLSINIGINDVWRQFDSPTIPEHHVLLEEYSQTLEELVKRTRPLVKGLVLMTPHFLDLNRADAMRARMDQYGDVVRALAKKYDAKLADTQAAFDEALKYLHPAAFAWDRIHPNQPGQMIMARTFLKAIEFEW